MQNMAERSPSVRKLAIDASAMAKWFLSDESYVAEALALKAEVDAGRASLHAPTHVHYEVANLLRRAVRARRITRVQAEQAITDMLEAPISLTDAPDILQEALALSLERNLSFYDACYLAVAQLINGSLISDDRNMRRALGGNDPHVVWLENYTPPQI